MGSLIVFIILFLILSAFFSGSEIAFISANKIRIELLKEQGHLRGRILSNFYEKPRDFLGTMLVGNNIALVVFTTLMTRLLNPFISPLLGHGVLLALVNTFTITMVVLIFGEFIPKTIFRVYANNMISILAVPLQFFKVLLSAPTWIMTQLSALLLRLFFRSTNEQSIQTFSRIDLEHFIQDSFEGDDDDEIDTGIFKNALRLKETKVRDCMVPRNEIVAIDEESSMEEVVNLFSKSKLSRILTYKGDIDNVTGYIHHQQMLEQPKKLKSAILHLPFVPEAMNVQDVMNQMFKSEKNIACVVDEFGGTAGMITLEDILEEIFGEIEDEHDDEGYIEEQISDHEWLFSGRLEMDYLNEKYEGLKLPTGDYNTLSGYLVMTTAKIPDEGTILDLVGYQFILEKVSSTRIETVRVIKILEKTTD
ncbi:MAG: HlyC/CorC family transporter [Saprospiraceae bacterium]|nr:HlyC/CorC family transporter [Saprospiraceae bacterium]